jgi:hypothetical protein
MIRGTYWDQQTDDGRARVEPLLGISGSAITGGSLMVQTEPSALAVFENAAGKGAHLAQA